MSGVGLKYFTEDPIEFMTKLYGLQGGKREGVAVNPQPGVVAYPPEATVGLQDNAGQ